VVKNTQEETKEISVGFVKMNKWTYWKLSRMNKNIQRKKRMVKTITKWIKAEEKEFSRILEYTR